MTTKPFPAITGGCHCAAVRYRILTAPLFCSACHCIDCQKDSGSAFSLHAAIETYNIKVISEAKPSLVTLTPDPAKPKEVSRHALCPRCGTILWGNDGQWDYAVSNVRIGTLDFPGIMEPDIHLFVGSKLGWIDLPKNAKTSQRGFEYKKAWPKTSLKRLELCLERFEAAKRALAPEEKKTEEAVRDKNESSFDGDGDKTPTATGDVDDGEDEEAFERRYQEAERALQERLAKLSLKLESEDKQASDTDTTTA
ncbi:glutathione-dependent formaldehyde-activating [Stagonosporopsis vannaccii]|nr:glutathione-dependent formaldehyde-activating [Stagonosporopsis vannaccii]